MTISTINRKLGLALLAGVLVVSAFAPFAVLADEDYGYSDYYGGDYSTGYDDYYGGGYDTSYSDYYGGDYSTSYDDFYGGDYATSYDDYFGGDTSTSYDDYYGGDYDTSYDSSYGSTGSSGYSSGYSSGSYSYPTFSTGYSSGSIYTTAANQQYRNYVASSLPTFAQSSVTNTCTAVNSCNDNSVTDNSYTDNSVYAPDNSYTDNSVYSAPTTVTVTTDSHNQQIGYATPEYHAPTFPHYQEQYQYQAQYQQPVYQPRPVAYNQTPYITLSQAPYTGLDLGPMGEVLYWTFLVLWCLAAAYLIVVKRVQNKLVSFLNGFLFGSTATKTVAHATHAPKAHAAASAPLVEEGIDPFIASQIKRA